MPREIERAFAFACALEAQPLADAEPTVAADAIRTSRTVEVTTDFVTRNVLEGEQTGGKGSQPSAVRSGRIHTFRVARRLRGRGVAYAAATLPHEHALLLAMFGAHTVDATAAAEKVTYNGVDEEEPTLSVIAQALKQEFKALGCVPQSARFTMEAGGLIMMETELIGVGQVPTQQVLEAATLDNIVPPVWKGATFTLDGVAVRPIQFTLDLGLSVSEPMLDALPGDAHAGYVITDRLPRGTMQIYVEDLNVFDPYSACADSDQLPFVGTFGTVKYNRARIEADRLEILQVTPATRGGVKVYDLEYQINRAIGPSVKDPVLIFD